MGSRHYDARSVKGIGADKSFAAAILRKLEDAKAKKGRITYPAVQFQSRGPSGETGIEWFAREVLGVRAWGKQRAIYEAVWDAIRPDSEKKRIVIQASQKSSKTFTACVIALWHLYCFEEPYNVLFVGPVERTIKSIIWPQLRELYRTSGTCLACREADLKCAHANPLPIEGGIFPRDPQTGVLSGTGNGATILGLLAGTDKEKIAGFSGIGGRQVFIVDEGSGIDDQGVAATISGNLAGAAYGYELWMSNPTKLRGPYYQYCTKHKDGGHHIQISAYDALQDPDAKLIPGLARRQWIEKTVKEGGGIGADEVRIRVLGQFPNREGDGGYFTPSLIEEAVARWTDKPSGKLIIAIDPAGPGVDADDCAFCILVGDTVFDIELEREMSSDEIFDHVLEIAHQWSPDRRYWVTWDGGGDIGFKLTETMRRRAPSVPLMDIRRGRNLASDKRYVRQPDLYDRVRDEMTGVLRERLVSGLALPPGCKELAEELAAISMRENQRGLLKMTPKPQIQRLIGGRSPDSFSALAIATYLEPSDPVKPMVGRKPDLTPSESTRQALQASRKQVQDPRRGLGRRW